MVTKLSGAREKTTGGVVSYVCQIHPEGSQTIVSNGEVTGWICVPEGEAAHILAHGGPETVEAAKAEGIVWLLYQTRVKDEKEKEGRRRQEGF